MSNERVYNVKNRSAGIVVYRIPEQGIRRVFQPGEVKRISHAELEALSYRAGGKEIISQYLQVRNIEALSELNINIESEYFMDKEQVEELIANGSVDQWVDALNFAPAGVIELIKQFSVSMPLADYNKRQILKEKLGFDIDKAIANAQADKEEEPVVAPTGPVRRSSPIIDKSALAESEAPKQPKEYKVISEG